MELPLRQFAMHAAMHQSTRLPVTDSEKNGTLNLVRSSEMKDSFFYHTAPITFQVARGWKQPFWCRRIFGDPVASRMLLWSPGCSQGAYLCMGGSDRYNISDTSNKTYAYWCWHRCSIITFSWHTVPVIWIMNSWFRVVALQVLLKEHNVPIDPRNWEGWTPICYTVSRGHIELMKYLLKNKADGEWSSAFGWKLLHIAAWWGFIYAMRTSGWLVLTFDQCN